VKKKFTKSFDSSLKYGIDTLQQQDELLTFIADRNINEYKNMDNNDKEKMTRTNVYILYCLKRILNLEYPINKWKRLDIEKEEEKKREWDYLLNITSNLTPQTINTITKMRKNSSYYTCLLNGFFFFFFIFLIFVFLFI
jgi:hypothetical protein